MLHPSSRLTETWPTVCAVSCVRMSSRGNSGCFGQMDSAGFTVFIWEYFGSSVSQWHYIFLFLSRRRTRWNVWHKPARTGRWQTLKRCVCRVWWLCLGHFFDFNKVRIFPPFSFVIDWKHPLLKPSIGTNRVQSRAEGWPHHQHPPDQAVRQPAGAEPHQGHWAFLQGTGKSSPAISDGYEYGSCRTTGSEKHL